MHRATAFIRAIARAFLPPFLAGILWFLPAAAPVQESGSGARSGLEERVRVELVHVAVTVVDRKGEPVADLRAEDFVITEDGRPVDVAVFEPPLAAPSPGPAAPDAGKAAGVSGRPAAPSPPAAPADPAGGRRYVVIWDGFNNPSGLRFHSARQAMLRFVDERMRPGDQMAVIELRPQMRVLTDLTSDGARVRQALREAAFLPGSRGGINQLIEASVTDTAFRNGSLAAQRLESLARFQQLLDSSGQREFYDNLTAIGEGLARLAGRKYVLLFSGGFPFLRATEQVYGFADYFPGAFRRMLNQLARSNVSIYSLNIGEESFGADVEQSGNIHLSLARVGMDENTLENLGLGDLFFGDDPFYAKQTLAVLAGETGGRFVNVPDYDRALSSIDRELQAVYTLAYYPSNPVEDGRFRRIAVRIPGRTRLTVQHRTGYFAPRPFGAMDDEERRQHLVEAALDGQVRSELPVDTRFGFLPVGAKDTMTTVVLDVPLVALHAGIHPKGLSYSLDVVLLARDVLGNLLDSVSKTVEAALDRDVSRSEVTLRLLESLRIPPGEAQLHVVVRDGHSGALMTQVESLEVPSFHRSTLVLSSLHLMRPGDGAALVDADFVPAMERRRLGQRARTREEGTAPPPPPDVENPFELPDGSTFRPGSGRAFEAGGELVVFFAAVNVAVGEEDGRPRTSVSFDLAPRDGGSLRLPSRQEPVVLEGRAGAPFTLVYRIGLPADLEPGDYDLRVTLLDKLGGVAARASEPVQIEGPGPSSPPPS